MGFAWDGILRPVALVSVVICDEFMIILELLLHFILFSGLLMVCSNLYKSKNHINNLAALFSFSEFGSIHHFFELARIIT